MRAPIVFSVVLYFLLAAPSSATSGLCGDADDNGELNVVDIVKIIHHILGNGLIEDPDLFCNSDSNSDDTINVVDIVFTVGVILGNAELDHGCLCEVPVLPSQLNWARPLIHDGENGITEEDVDYIDEVETVITLSDGSIAIGGQFGDFSSTDPPFVLRLDEDGNLLNHWSVSDSHDRVMKIASLSEDTLAVGTWHNLIHKFDLQGTALWTEPVDIDDNIDSVEVYLKSMTRVTVQGEEYIIAVGLAASDMFLAAYKADDGAFVWLKTVGHDEGRIEAVDVAALPNNELVIVGNIIGPGAAWQETGEEIGSLQGDATVDRDIMVMKLSPTTGTANYDLDWAVRRAAAGRARAMAVTPTADGNIAIVGDFFKELYDAPEPANNDPILISQGGGCEGFNEHGLDGGPWPASDVFMAKMSAETGAINWIRASGASKQCERESVYDVVENNGLLAMVGTMAFTGMTFSGPTLSCLMRISGHGLGANYPNFLSRDSWFAVYADNGDFVWAQSMGNIHADYAKGVTANQEHGFVVAGNSQDIEDMVFDIPEGLTIAGGFRAGFATAYQVYSGADGFSDTDNDGLSDLCDACPNGIANWIPESENDFDDDGCYTDEQDDEDDDEDNDNVLDVDDACPNGYMGWTSNAETDPDSDGCFSVAEDDDDDDDGILDADPDNCPLVPNEDQSDADGDEIGDICDDDLDGDDVLNEEDNCVWNENPDQLDFDADEIGNVCDDDNDNDGLTDDNDTDDDGDTVLDTEDNCPIQSNIDQEDFDEDELGDACDPDDDNDGVVDEVDECLFVGANGEDYDGDGCVNSIDDDDDGDGVLDEVDACNDAEAETNWLSMSASDRDGDGCYDYLEDDDDDNDGVADTDDDCNDYGDEMNWESNSETDFDGDGCHDTLGSFNNSSTWGEDVDDDNDSDPDFIDLCPLDAQNDGDVDGHCANIDNCPGIWNENQEDADNDAVGDVCDVCEEGDDNLDHNNDGVPDACGCVRPTAISRSVYNTCVILSDGNIKCWGSNQYGQLGLNNSISMGDDPGEMSDFLSTALLFDEEVYDLVTSWGRTCVAFKTGAMKCWGYPLSVEDPAGYYAGNAPGEMENIAPMNLGADLVVTEMALSQSHTCVLLKDSTNVQTPSSCGNGCVKCWGSGTSGQVGQSVSASDLANGEIAPIALGVSNNEAYAVQVGVGVSHSCALFNTGAVKCWGSNSNEQLGVAGGNVNTEEEMGEALLPAELPGSVVSLALGRSHSCALLADDNLVCWGANQKGQLGNGTNTTTEASSVMPVIDFGGVAVEKVTAFDDTTCALLSTGEAYCWGDNDHWMLGSPELINSNLPVQIDLGNVTVLEIDMGCAFLADFSLKCWGKNSYGQLGLGDTEHRGDDSGEMGEALPVICIGNDGYCTGGPDTDGDGANDTCDNCEGIENQSQTDTDEDGLGNTCDEVDDDSDNDGIVDSLDECSGVDFEANWDSNSITDNDADGCHDFLGTYSAGSSEYGEDLDDDNDLLPDFADNCPLVPNNPGQEDGDEDGIGDACDETP